MSKKVGSRLLLIFLLVVSMNIFIFTDLSLSGNIKDKNNKKDLNQQSKVSFSAVGDVLIEDGMYDWLADDYDFKDLFDDISDVILADLMFMNQESVLADQVEGSGPTFIAPYQIAEQLIDKGFNILSLANNHSLDAGEAGIDKTLDYLDGYNDIIYNGVNRYIDNDESINIIEVNGIKFGFMAYTAFVNKGASSHIENRTSLVNYFTVPEIKEITEETRLKVKEDLDRYKDNCDIMIVSAHWGEEFTYQVNDQQKEFATYLNSLGVDLIIGHHPHAIQPIEWIETEENSTLVVYSLGNFLASDVSIVNSYNLGGILTLDFIKKADVTTLENVIFHPFVNHYEKDYTNFHLYLLEDYNEVLASRHYRNDYIKRVNAAYDSGLSVMSKVSLSNDVKGVVNQVFLKGEDYK